MASMTSKAWHSVVQSQIIWNLAKYTVVAILVKLFYHLLKSASSSKTPGLQKD